MKYLLNDIKKVIFQNKIVQLGRKQAGKFYTRDGSLFEVRGGVVLLDDPLVFTIIFAGPAF